MAKQRQTEFKPNYAVPPGATLQEALDERGMSEADLAQRTGQSIETINLILGGFDPITPEIAAEFEQALGIPAHLWNNLERHYRETLARLQDELCSALATTSNSTSELRELYIRSDKHLFDGLIREQPVDEPSGNLIREKESASERTATILALFRALPDAEQAEVLVLLQGVHNER